MLLRIPRPVVHTIMMARIEAFVHGYNRGSVSRAMASSIPASGPRLLSRTYRQRARPRRAHPGERVARAKHPVKIARQIASMAVAVSALAVASLTTAQTYPVKPVRLIAPFPTGASQILAHLVSEKLGESLGQPVIVDFRPGGGGNIGAEIAAKAPADGYHLVILSSSHTTSPSMYKQLKYDALRDFAPISLIATVPNLIVVHPSLPVKTLKELAALARTYPGKISFGSGGVGSSNHLASELFASLNKVKIVHIPYKGASIALTHILSGEADMVVVTVPATIAFINAGRLRGLALLDKKRVPTLPNLPTSAEAGMPELLLTTWYGLAAPAGVRGEILERLHRDLTAAMRSTDVGQRLTKVGIDAVTSTPGAFGEFLRTEVRRWGQVIKAANVQFD
jgi:tripartite-type tricarboxylate transporter receptor subunit TctC